MLEGRIRLKRKAIEVRPNPFEEESNIKEKLFVLRIEVYPASTRNNFFAVRLEKKGMHNRYVSY